MRTSRFQVPAKLSRRRLVAALAESFALERDAVLETDTRLLDTFDWRLHGKGLVLSSETEHATLRRLEDWSVVRRERVAACPRFAWDLPKGSLRKKLTPLLQVRALLDIGGYSSRITPISIRDKKGTILARLTHEEIRLHPIEGQAKGSAKRRARRITVLTLDPSRGYARQSQKIARKLIETGLKPMTNSIHSLLLDASGVKPGTYSTRPRIDLRPEVPASYAIPMLLLFYLVEVIRKNEEGVREDIDTEFLHDFRVASRRTRSILRELRDLFPKKRMKRFRTELSYLGKETNDLRDFDVYLQSADRYRAAIPSELAGDLEPVFDLLRKKRKATLRKVIRFLDSPRYSTIVEDWERFLREEASGLVDEAVGDEPVVTIADRRIFRKYKEVTDLGSEIRADSKDASYHRLRIVCKQLRYLMEFFSSLYPGRLMSLIRPLKSLQDALGEIQDLAVQTEYLISLASEISLPKPQQTKTSIAIETLVQELCRRKQDARLSVLESFERFASSRSRKSLKRLLRRPK